MTQQEFNPVLEQIVSETRELITDVLALAEAFRAGGLHDKAEYWTRAAAILQEEFDLALNPGTDAFAAIISNN